jgi:hypothetical protein
MWPTSAGTSVVVVAAVLLADGFTAEAVGQERRLTAFGDVGFASIGHADSEQGKAPLIGGGAAFQLTRHVAIEGDVHGARVRHVFGREHHDFTQVTVTGSLLVSAPVAGRARLLAGVGWGLQRAHIEFDTPPIGTVKRSETIRLLHGRIGAEWDASDRVVVRTLGVLWIGSGVDWVLGGRVGVGYRF